MTLSNTLAIGLQGIQAGMNRATIAGSRVATLSMDADQLARNTVEQMAARHQVGFSAQVVKAADDMIGTLIDLRA